VATWHFINPLHFQNALPLLTSIEGAFTSSVSKLSEEVCASTLHVLGVEAYLKVDQRVGEVVYIPPGWVHAVFTKVPCFKMAWDFIVPEHLPLYMAAWREIATKLSNTAEDYMAVVQMLVKHALSAA